MSCLSTKHSTSDTIFSHLLLILFNNKMIYADFSQQQFVFFLNCWKESLSFFLSSSSLQFSLDLETSWTQNKKPGWVRLPSFLFIRPLKKKRKSSSWPSPVLIEKTVSHSVAIDICLTVNFKFIPSSCSWCWFSVTLITLLGGFLLDLHSLQRVEVAFPSVWKQSDLTAKLSFLQAAKPRFLPSNI